MIDIKHHPRTHNFYVDPQARLLDIPAPAHPRRAPLGTPLEIWRVPEVERLLPGDLRLPLHDTTATGEPIFSNGHLGVDLLYVPTGENFPLHTHPGHHLLYIVRGLGTVTFNGNVYETRPGDLYMINALVEHAVGAHPHGPGHWLLSFGAPHTPLTSPDRMRVVPDAPAP